MLIHCQPDGGRPLDEGVVGAEMEQIAIAARRGKTQDILQRLFVV
jgi:hypothetical protein